MISKSTAIVTLAEAILATVLVTQLWSRPLSLFSYVAVVALFGLLISYEVVIAKKNGKLLIAKLLLIILFLKEANVLVLHYAVLPGGDGYGYYDLLLQYIQSGHVSVLLQGGGSNPQNSNLYSGWPGLQLVAAEVTLATGATPLMVAMVSPLLFFLSWLSFCGLIVREVKQKLNLPSSFVYLSLVTIGSSPVLFGLEFKSQYVSLVPWILALYLIIHKGRLHLREYLLIFVAFAAIDVMHPYSSIVLSLFLLVGYILNVLVSRFPVVRSQLKAGAMPQITLGTILLSTIVFVSWWTLYAQVAWLQFASYYSGLIKAIQQLGFQTSGFTISNPALVQLTPSWLKGLLLGNLILVLAAIPFGFLLFWKNYSRLDVGTKIVSASMMLAPLGIMDVLFGGESIPFRIVLFAWQYFVVFIAFFLSSAMVRSPILGKSVVFCVTLVLVSSALLGFGFTQQPPIHWYDSQVSFQQAGDHTINWRPFSLYLDNHLDPGAHYLYLTDEVYTMILSLPPSDQFDVFNFQDVQSRLVGPTIIVSFNNMNQYAFYGQVYNPSAHFSAKSFDSMLANTDQVYNDGAIMAWDTR